MLFRKHKEELAALQHRLVTEITARQRMEEALRKEHQELEKRVQERTAELAQANEDLRNEIAERKRAEEALHESVEQFRHSQKMEAIGRLAGGVAHDFNNMLTVVMANTLFLLKEMDAQSPFFQELQEIRNAAQRAAALTKQLLAFSRKQPRQPRSLDLNAVVMELTPMMQRLLGEDIYCETALTPELGLVMADPNQLEQVIMNLVVNARDAMPHGGSLTLATANVELEEAEQRAGAKRYVMLAISDTGCGMDEETQAHIFEPFYTTKPTGQGTGLGLATVYGIIKQSDGLIKLESRLGRGTTFKIYLPLLEKGSVTEEPPSIQKTTPRGSEFVLLVEDEPAVLRLIRRILEQEGYSVLAANSGAAALEKVEQHKGPIHLLVTDVVMPGMSGPELARQLTASRPDLKILYISGYNENAIIHHIVVNPGVTLLPKPFTPDVLARMVREVLDQPA